MLTGYTCENRRGYEVRYVTLLTMHRAMIDVRTKEDANNVRTRLPLVVVLFCVSFVQSYVSVQ